MVENVTLTTYQQSRKARKVLLQSLLILFLVFLALSRWIPGSDPLNPEEGTRGWIEVGLAVSSFLLMVLFWGFRPLLLGFKSPTFIVLSVYGVWALITSLWAPSFLVAFGKAGVFIVTMLVMSGIATQTITYKLSVIQMILISVLALILFLLVINLFAYHALFPIGRSVDRPRFELAYEHPNTASTYFATIILCCSYFLTRKNNFLMRLLLWMCLFSFIVLLVLSDSRTSMASALVTVTFLLLLQIRSARVRLGLFVLGGFILSLLALVVLSTSLIKDIIPTLNEDMITLNGRIPLWQSLIQQTSNNFLFGNGYFSTRFSLLSDYQWGYHAHNSYIDVLISTGIIGILIMIVFFISCFKFSRKDTLLPVTAAFFLYICLESMLETRLFVPNILMCVVSLLIFRQQLYRYEP
jgi:O-antigen ligase